MRAIRAAIGTVDHKITESNALNTQLHERMNGIDAALATNKRTQADALARVKAAALATKDAEARLESATAALAAVDARLGKVEAESRAREGRERERRRLDKEKEEQTQAQSPAPSAGVSTSATAAAAAAAGPGAGGESDVPDSWKSVLNEHLKRERGKAKVASKTLELALQEQIASSSAALAARVDALENARKRAAAAEEKRRAEDLATAGRAHEQARADLEAHRALLEQQRARVELLVEHDVDARATLDALAATVAVENAAVRASVSECDAQLRSLVAAESTRLDALESASAGASAAAASSSFSSSDGAQLRADLDTLVGKSNQQWALLSACNKEVMVSAAAVANRKPAGWVNGRAGGTTRAQLHLGGRRCVASLRP